MFKVGDKVVYRKQCRTIWDGVYTVDAVRKNGDVVERDGVVPKEWLSKATPEEIAAGHRIDDLEIEVSFGIRLMSPERLACIDMGDDSHIENHISPHCKVSEACVDEALKLNRLG